MTMQNCHAVVWIDHRMAEIVKFNRSEADAQELRHRDAPAQVHHKSGSVGAGHVYEDHAYLGSVVDGLRDAETILITGPGQVKWQLKTFMASRAPGLATRVVAVQPLDHPTERELLAIARGFFAQHDRMRLH